MVHVAIAIWDTEVLWQCVAFLFCFLFIVLLLQVVFKLLLQLLGVFYFYIPTLDIEYLGIQLIGIFYF